MSLCMYCGVKKEMSDSLPFLLKKMRKINKDKF